MLINAIIISNVLYFCFFIITWRLRYKWLRTRHNIGAEDVRPFFAGLFWPITWVVAICILFADFIAEDFS